MTVIAWDGKTLAGDKRAVFQGLSRTVTKVFRIGDCLVGIAGNAAEGYDMIEWIRGGRKADAFPILQRDEKAFVNCLVIEVDGRVNLYERSPSPIRLEDARAAIGSGRDYAIAAMHLGKTAAEAVEIASIFELSCGNGVDEVSLG